ncbi:MAG: divergent polysaccharide deacetylase family protein [Desulfovibrio sp.]|nr:divergent polysaccharide deacetylase family protein [Desulfovibrio sp.]MBI4960071.1 divergent polysaccharide deacetylase family protein [Desulfovibrio sp.]
MAQKRPGKPRRRPASKKRGRTPTPAALVFFAGVALAAIILFFGYAFFYLPQKQAEKAQPQTQTQGKAQAPAQAPAAPPVSDQAQAPAQTPVVPPVSPQISEAKPGGPRLTIVIDDLGGSPDQAKELLDLGLPVTFSILPNLTYTKEVDAMAAKAGMEVILHQPMGAYGNSPESPGTLKSGMTVPEVARILTAHLAQLPHATGVSNHTGSKATEDPVLMAAVMVELKSRNLLFLDSLTSAKSVGLKEAAKAGVPAIPRTVFLDNERGQQAALLMLAQAEKEARTKGKAVAIGHPYPETIGALAVWSIRRDKAVRLVPLSALLKTD